MSLIPTPLKIAAGLAVALMLSSVVALTYFQGRTDGRNAGAAETLSKMHEAISDRDKADRDAGSASDRELIERLRPTR